jgi:5-methylcytosine-specific restriction enzyme A
MKMGTFLITFKPASENPEHGWPLEKLQSLVRRQQSGDTVEEKWRFHNRKDVTLGDRAFLLLQGKGGSAIIGYGQVNGQPEKGAGQWVVPIKFESLVDPSIEVLASKSEVRSIEGGQRYWRTQSSGVQLPEDVAANLETLVVGKAPKPWKEKIASNPDWTRDELIVALSFYLKHRPNPPSKDSEAIADLSRILNRLGEKLFPSEQRAATFRNENGVYMKLMNFRRLDPEYTSGGRIGLARGAKTEKEVWAEFAHDPAHCKEVADAIIASLDEPEGDVAWHEPDGDEDLREAPEGRLLTRRHLARERNRKLVESKRQQVMKKYKKLACEVCHFDFAIRYGDRGKGFIECHHTKPLATLAAGHKTHIDDLAVVCANCHRMIHRRKPWLSVAELRERIRAT